MDSKETLTLIQLGLGKASVAFMSQPDGGKIVMPTEELLETANELCEAIMAMARKDYARIAELEAECARLTTERDASQAAMVDGALREADLLSRAEKAEAEYEALRADVVWLLAHKMIGYGDRISYAKEPRSWSLRKELDHDGTPDGILRAVREARTR